MPNARPRRKRGWLFGRRGNRRVRPPSTPGVEAVKGEVDKPRGKRALVFVGLAVALGGAAAGGVWFFTHSKHFAVRAVRSSPTVHVSAESLSARGGVAIGQNLFAVDLEEIAREVMAEPWIAKATARRELPSTIALDVVEREAACVVSLGGLYLADPEGRVFKRATPEEAAKLPVVTGIERDEYLDSPMESRARVRDALTVIARFKERATRPTLGEVHSDARMGVTAYSASGVGLRIGRIDDTLADRLGRLDAVWAELERTHESARFIYLDNRARPDRVTVKLRPASPAQKSET